MKKNVGLACWFVQTFCDPLITKELLIEACVPDMKRFVAGLLKTAMEVLYPFEEEELKKFAKLAE